MRLRSLAILLAVIGMVGLAGCSVNLGGVDTADSTDPSLEVNNTGDVTAWDDAFDRASPRDAVSVQTYRQRHRNIQHATGVSEADQQEMEELAAELKPDLVSHYDSVFQDGVLQDGRQPFEATAVIQSNARAHDEDVVASEYAITVHSVNYRFTGDYLYSSENTSRSVPESESGHVYEVPLATEGHIAEEYSPVAPSGGFPETYIRYQESETGDEALHKANVAYRNQYLYQHPSNAPYDDSYSPVRTLLTASEHFEYEGFTTDFPTAEGDRIIRYSLESQFTDPSEMSGSWYYLMYNHGFIGEETFYHNAPSHFNADVFVNTDGELVGMSYSKQDMDSIGGAVLIDYKPTSEMPDVTDGDDWRTPDSADIPQPTWTLNKEKLENAGTARLGGEESTHKVIAVDLNQHVRSGFVFAPPYPRSAAQAGEFTETLQEDGWLYVAHRDGAIAATVQGAPTGVEHDSSEGAIGPMVIVDSYGTPVYWGQPERWQPD